MISAVGVSIYSSFTGSESSSNESLKSTLIDTLDPNFENIEGYIFQKVYDKDYPYALNPNTSKIYENIEYSINSDEFRDKEYTVEKNGSRIIFIGDSFTFGWRVQLNHTFVKILEERLQQDYPDDNWEVMNLGVAAYDTKWEVAFLEEKGLK